ncbi:hypothetical protein ACS0TY_021747 [Phlomoides rotata]
MAANHQQQDHQVLAPSSMPRSDAENANINYQFELMRNKKKKRMRCMAYIAIFALIQIIVTLYIALAVIRVKSPRLRMDRVVVSSDPSGDLRFAARVLVRNRNFGRYKFDATYATVRSTNNNNNNVGQFLIDDEGRVRARSTKKIAVIWDVRSSNSSSRSMDLMVEAKMRGKVEVFRVIKRRKSGDMNCSMTVDLDTNGVRNLRCM